MDTLRSLPPADPSSSQKPILVPGDPERNSEKKTRRLGFIRYTSDHITSYRRLAKELGVKPMEKFQG